MTTNYIYSKLFAVYLYLASRVLHENTSDLLSEIKPVYFETISTSYANWVSFCFFHVAIYRNYCDLHLIIDPLKKLHLTKSLFDHLYIIVCVFAYFKVKY